MISDDIPVLLRMANLRVTEKKENCRSVSARQGYMNVVRQISWKRTTERVDSKAPVASKELACVVYASSVILDVIWGGVGKMELEGY